MKSGGHLPAASLPLLGSTQDFLIQSLIYPSIGSSAPNVCAKSPTRVNPQFPADSSRPNPGHRVAEVPAALAGALQDRYRIERELGAGGMATVYLAQDLRHGRQVAVKVLRPELAATLGPQRFLQEIQIAARLTHPHILPLHDSGESGGFLFYVMPYVEGESLRDKLGREGELPVAESVRILKEVTDALAYAHGRGVVHRDIKPENVMLSGRHALVTDFGVAKALREATGRQQQTTAGVALGTPAYMAPEQAAADPHMDHRADIYAVGAMGYELLTGRPPFTGSSPQAVLAAQVTEQPRPVTDHRHAVPPAVANTIMRCLEKKPADRWQTAGELHAQLESLASTPSGGITPAATRPIDALVIPARPARRWAWGVLAGAAILAVLGLATARYLGNGTPPVVRDRIAVLPFDNRTGDPNQAAAGIALGERIIAAAGGEGLSLVSSAVAFSAMPVAGGDAGKRASAVSRTTGSGVVVSGAYYKRPGGIEYQVELLSMPAGKQLVTLDPILVDAAQSSSLDGLVERVLVALVMNQESGIEFAFTGNALPRSLPSFREFLHGDNLSSHNSGAEAEAAFTRAMALDSTWFLPVIRRGWVLLGEGKYSDAEAAIVALDRRASQLRPADRDGVDALRAYLHGDLEAYYRVVRRLAARSPLTYSSSEEIAAFMTRRLDESLRLSETRDSATYDNLSGRRGAGMHVDRGLALHMLGRHKEELALALEMRRDFPDDPLTTITAELMARAALGQISEVEHLVDEAEGLRRTEWSFTRASIAALELDAHGQAEAARQMYARALRWYDSRSREEMARAEWRSQYAEALFEGHRWPEALGILEGLVAEAPDSIGYLDFEGEVMARLNRRDEAQRVADHLASMRRPYLFGRALQAQGCIEATLGNLSRAVELFRQAYAEGYAFAHWVHRDRCYDGIRAYPAFIEFLRPR